MNLVDLEKLDPSLKPFKIYNPGACIQGPGNIRKVTPQNLIFVKDQKNLKILETADKKNLESAVLVCFEKIASELEKFDVAAILIAKDINHSFLLWSKIFYDKKIGELDLIKNIRDEFSSDWQIADDVFIGEGVTIGEGSIIHSGCKIMAGSKIGKNVQIYPSVILYPFTEVGNGCRVHSLTTIGSDGFGYTYHKGEHQKIWHFGGVQIQENVEIGANSSIDGGTFSPTIIGYGSKIDNQVQIGHNCELGKLVIVCGGTDIGGSTKIEDGCVIGGSACIRDGIEIGAGSQIAGNSGVTSSWPAKSVIAGHPARALKEWLRGVAAMRKLIKK